MLKSLIKLYRQAYLNEKMRRSLAPSVLGRQGRKRPRMENNSGCGVFKAFKAPWRSSGSSSGRSSASRAVEKRRVLEEPLSATTSQPKAKRRAKTDKVEKTKRKCKKVNVATSQNAKARSSKADPKMLKGAGVTSSTAGKENQVDDAAKGAGYVEYELADTAPGIDTPSTHSITQMVSEKSCHLHDDGDAFSTCSIPASELEAFSADATTLGTEAIGTGTQLLEEKGGQRRWYEDIDITDLTPNEIFRQIWPKLKKRGWKVTGGSGLYNYYYLAPNVKKKNGVLGENMFGTEEDVVGYIVQ